MLTSTLYGTPHRKMSKLTALKRQFIEKTRSEYQNNTIMRLDTFIKKIALKNKRKQL